MAPSFQPVLRDLCVELLAGDLEQLGRLQLVALGGLERALDDRPLRVGEAADRQVLDDRRTLPYRTARQHRWQVLKTDAWRATEGERALDGVGEFAHVARPRVTAHRLQRRLLDSRHRLLAHLPRVEQIDE